MPTLRPHPVLEVAPGVTRQRNGLLIDASKCPSYTEAQVHPDAPKETDSHHEKDEGGSSEGHPEPSGDETVRDNQ